MIPQDFSCCYYSSMRNLAVLVIHLIATLARLLGPGGVRSLVAESLLLKHQLLIVNRSRQRSPNLSAGDRILAGLLALLVRPARLLRSAIVLKPSTLLALHQALSKRKYRMLFSPNRPRKPGPKGPSPELIRAVVEMKQRNPNWGSPRIAQQIALAFNIQIDKDIVRRILARHYRPAQDSGGPSWLTFLGQSRKSLRLCFVGLRIRWIDPIAEVSELPDHSRRAPLFRLFGDGWAAFFVTDSLVQDQPDQPTLSMGNGPDGLIVSQARDGAAIHNLEDASFGPGCGVRSLIE
jgi:hypothetical protein